MLFRQRRMTITNSDTYGVNYYCVEERFTNVSLVFSEWEKIAPSVCESTALKIVNFSDGPFDSYYSNGINLS